MNLPVTYMHFFLEAPFADVIRTSICILAGVNPPMLFLIMAIDGTWGAFIASPCASRPESVVYRHEFL
jgi:hypothetical protein